MERPALPPLQTALASPPPSPRARAYNEGTRGVSAGCAQGEGAKQRARATCTRLSARDAFAPIASRYNVGVTRAPGTSEVEV